MTDSTEHQITGAGGTPLLLAVGDPVLVMSGNVNGPWGGTYRSAKYDMVEIADAQQLPHWVPASQITVPPPF